MLSPPHVIHFVSPTLASIWRSRKLEYVRGSFSSQTGSGEELPRSVTSEPYALTICGLLVQDRAEIQR